MKHETLKSVRALYFVPMTALCLMSATQAQTSPSEVPSAIMPLGHLQKGMSGSNDMKQLMITGMDSMQKMEMSGNIDKDFAMMMRMHHQQGVEMAQMELEHGESPAMKAVARQIIAAQKKEIARFEQWLAKQK